MKFSITLLIVCVLLLGFTVQIVSKSPCPNCGVCDWSIEKKNSKTILTCNACSTEIILDSHPVYTSEPMRYQDLPVMDEVPDGAVIISIRGVITFASYMEEFHRPYIYDDSIGVNDVLQVYVTENPDENAWKRYSYSVERAGSVLILGESHFLHHHHYLIFIIKLTE